MRSTADTSTRRSSTWRTQLEGLPEAFSPATHQQRTERPTGLGPERRLAIDPELASLVAGTCQTRASTPFMANLAVFGAFCRALGAPDDLVVGALVSGRSTPRLTRLVGCSTTSFRFACPCRETRRSPNWPSGRGGRRPRH